MKHPWQTENFHINLPLLSNVRLHIACACLHVERKTEKDGKKGGKEDRAKKKEARIGNGIKNFFISCITSFDIITLQPFICIKSCFISIRWWKLCSGIGASRQKWNTTSSPRTGFSWHQFSTDTTATCTLIADDLRSLVQFWLLGPKKKWLNLLIKITNQETIM